MEEDGVDVVATALWDNLVAAKLLLCLSRPEADVLSLPLPPPPPPTELTWRKKGFRSRTITREGIRAAESEDARLASPTTPLSWSVDGSGTSGSVCSGAGAASRGRKKRVRDGENGEANKGRCAAARVKRIRVPLPLPPAKRTKHEPPLDGEPAANSLGASGISASDDKVVAVVSSDDAVGKPAAVECPEPLRWMSAVSLSVGPVVIGRQGKKKTFSELQTMEELLLQEQAGLRKELESQMALHGALLEENARLKKVELTLALRREAMPAQAVQITQRVEHSSPEPVEPVVLLSPRPAPAALEQGGGGGAGEPKSSAQRPAIFFPFDLYCMPLDIGGF